MSMINTMRNDLFSVLERDPAARNRLEVLFCYPGLHAVWGHRVAHWLWIHKLRFLARFLSQIMRGLTGIEIHPGARLGPQLFIDHGMGVVIGETAEVGRCVTLYHGVTLGGTSLDKGKRHPTLDDHVVVGAGAKILGNIKIGANSRVGANAVVVKSVPPNAVVVGVPGQVVARSRPRDLRLPDLEHDRLPDALGDALVGLMQRVEVLEEHFNGHHEHEPELHMPEHGVWRGEDFSI
jgi:serine O-acetyltransferase